MVYNPGHILVVDDDELNRMTLAHGVKQQGHTVALAENGQQALEMLQAQSFDLVLLDIVMPEMDGYQVLEHVKGDNALRNIPVVVISAIDEMDSAAKCISMGAEDYLAKPFNPVLLKARIGACLEKKRLRDQERAYLKHLQIERERLVLLNQVSQELTATLDLPQVVDRLLQAVIAIVGAEGVSVWLRNKKRGHLICQASFYHLQKHRRANPCQPAGKGIVGWVATTGNSTIVPYAPDDSRFSPDIDEQVGFRTTSLLAVPLRVRQAVIGVLAVTNKLSGDFDRDDCTLVETMAASAAIALDNAELFKSLRQHAAILEARNEELDAFAHTVAHDLKNPLGAILGLAGGLEGSYGSLNEQKLQLYLHTIAQTSRKMNNIINELLLLANVRQVEEVTLTPLDMDTVVAEAENRLADLIEEYQAEIILPPSWPVVKSYGPWVEEIWVNYISNAIKYGGQPPHVELGATLPSIPPTSAGETQDGQVRFWVRDNGPGLKPDEQARLFTPFTRLDQAHAKGHGLGLSIVRRIIEKLGGQVSVDSQVGQGCVFTFTLPAGNQHS
jgi:signal transduction histidine kinase/DNA-binding response OmpR family regulator